MGKISKKWLQVYTYTMRYVATILSFSTLVIDILILFNKTTIITYSIAGGSLLTLFVIYCGIRLLGYCYIQRCLIWLTGMNIIFNAFIGYFKFYYSCGLKIISPVSWFIPSTIARLSS